MGIPMKLLASIIASTFAGPVVIAGPQLAARPAAGLVYQGMLQGTVPGTSTPVTAYDCEVAFRLKAAGNKLYFDVWNGTKANGDIPEVFSSTDLKIEARVNTTRVDNSTLTIPAFNNANDGTFIPLTGGKFSFGTFYVDSSNMVPGRNFVIMFRITHPDGVSQVVIPLGTPADYGNTVLGEIGGAGGFGRGQEGNIWNSATSRLTASPGGAEWGGRLPAHMFRPLAVYFKDVPKIVSCSVHADSIGSPISSYIARILNAADIPNANIGSGGESQRNYPTNTAGRFRVVPYAKTALVEHCRNSFGAGLEAAKNASLALWAQLRAAGALRVVQTTCGPMTSKIDPNNASTNTDNQNPEGGGIRIAYNAWLRTVVGTATGPDKLWDVEPLVSTPDLLKFKDGFSSDLLHFTTLADTTVFNFAVANNWAADII